jgi:hypothetical protein
MVREQVALLANEVVTTINVVEEHDVVACCQRDVRTILGTEARREVGSTPVN